jgi:hypothetical protein
MSQAFKPPKNEGESFKSEYKQPDLIIIDDDPKDRPQNQSDSSEQASAQPSFDETTPTYQSVTALRLMCTLGFVVCFVAALFGLVGLTLVFLLSLVTLFTNSQLNQSLYACWKIYLNLVITTLGFGLGILFPRLGLGLLLFYFAMSGQATDPGIWRQIFQRSFGN